MRLHRFAACCFVLLAPISYGHASDGTITGTVLDDRGRPLEGAQVCVHDDAGKDRITHCETITDQTGQFQIQHVPFGKQIVSASKREEGYGGVTNGPPYEVVTLTSENPLARAILKLGPKDGILAPTASDKISGKPIYNFMVSWTIQEENSSQTATSGLSRWTKRVPVPVGKDVCPSFSAKGYQTFVPRDPSDLSKPLCIRLQSGEVKSLAVELVPGSNGGAVQ